MNETRWQALNRPLARVMLCTMLAVSLQGCLEIAMGSAVVGTLAAVDRRTLGAQTDDKTIPLKAASRFRETLKESYNINVNVFNRKVLLTGEVKDEAMRQEAARLVANIDGVEGVHNELVVDFVSGFGARSHDTLLTTKVKASLIDAKDLQSNAIKVTTERGVVYLQGMVTERESTRAAEVAAGVGGVMKVVKLFDTITEDQLARLTSSPVQGGAEKPAAASADSNRQGM